MKVVTSKNDSKKRKREHSEDAVTESPKKAKVHAQRKFAQGAYNSPSLTVVKDKVRPPTNVTSPGLVLSAKRPNTEDFLTFLCFRRTSILPPKLNFFKDAFRHQPDPSNCVQKAPNSAPSHKNHTTDSSTKSSSKKTDKTEPSKKMQTPVQALRRKYQEQRLAKQNPTNVRKLAQKVKGKNMIRTRSSTLKDESVKPKKILEKLNSKTNKTGLRSGLQRTPPTADARKKKNVIEVKNLRSSVKGKAVKNKPKPKPLPEKKKVLSREVPLKKNEVVKNNKSAEGTSGKLKDVKVNMRKIEGLSDFSSDDNEPLLAVRKGKPAAKGKKVTNGVKESPKPNSVKTRSQAIEAPHVPVRPTRKTKEAAAIYMEMITKKLVSPEKSGDDDRSSVDSFPELPNARRNEQRESEIKARAMAMKKGSVRVGNSSTNIEGKNNRISAFGKRKDTGKNADSGRNEGAKKLAIGKKVIREEPPRKVKEETKKVEVLRKSIRDDRKDAREDFTRKVLRDRKKVTKEAQKKNTADFGKDEGLKRGGKEEQGKKCQDDNLRRGAKEETAKKVHEDHVKKTSREDNIRKFNRDETLKKSQEESSRKNKDEMIRRNHQDNVKKGNKEEAMMKSTKDEEVKKIQEVRKEEVAKKTEEHMKKNNKEDTKKLHEDFKEKVNKDEVLKKNQEENMKKISKEEVRKKNHEDCLKEIVKEVPKIVKEAVSKKSDMETEVPKKEEIKKVSDEDVKKTINDAPEKVNTQTVVFHDKKPLKQDESKKESIAKEVLTKNVKEEVTHIIPMEESVISQVPTKKISESECAKKGLAKEERKMDIGIDLTPETEEKEVKISEASDQERVEEVVKTVQEKKTDTSESPQKVVQDPVEGGDPAEKEEIKRREVSPKRTNKTAEVDTEKVDKKPSDDDSRPSTRGRKQEEPELKQKKVPERTTGVKKPTSVPKKGSGSGSSTPSNSWLPSSALGSNLLEAPTFYPTEKEFQDPLEFFEKIRPAAESFGLCRIVPPSNFKPDCKVSDDMRFTAYNQYVHRMFHRWGPNIKEMMAIKKYLATQSISLKQPPWIGGIEVDLPRLYQSVQNCGGLMKVMEKKKWHQVADMMRIPKAAQDRVTKLDDIYCKYLLPYDTLSHDERQKLFDEVENDWLRRQDSVTEEDSEEDSYIDECEECIVKGRNMALNQFYRIARNTMSMWFKSQEPQPLEVENEFWRHVSERNSHVCVHSGSIDSSGWGYGFPVAKNNSFSRHPWNLKVLTNNSGSVLRSLGPVMGVTVPTLHVGMVFTAFCWYRDPHGLPWVEYLHTGAPKIWYGISDDNSSVFKEALTKLLPRYIKNKKIWLPSDTAMVPPALLIEQGVSLCHTIQKPGQFILVFPRAFTSSICTGYLVSESVYFAQPSWLTTAEQVFRDIQDCCEPTMFSLEKLLFSIATDSRCSVEVLKQVLPMVWHIKQNEIDGRKTLLNLGLKTSERLPAKDQAGSRKKKGRWAQDGEGDYECEVCRTNLCVSLVINSQEEGVLCLPHAIDLLTQKRHHLKYCKLMYSYTQEELCELVEKLEQRIESKSQKKVQSKSASATK